MIFLRKVLYYVFESRMFLLLFAFLMFSSITYSQEDESDEELDFISLKKSKSDNNKYGDSEEYSNVAFKLSFFMPSIAAEFKLAEKFSMEVAGKLNFQIYISDSNTSPKLHFFPLPVAHIEPKWNYNIKKRLEKGKNVSGFSSNFISLFTSYRIKVSDETFHSLVIGPTWGLQRKLGGFGYLKFNAGLVYNHAFDSRIQSQIIQQSPFGLPIGPIVDFQIGVMF